MLEVQKCFPLHELKDRKPINCTLSLLLSRTSKIRHNSVHYSNPQFSSICSKYSFLTPDITFAFIQCHLSQLEGLFLVTSPAFNYPALAVSLYQKAFSMNTSIYLSTRLSIILSLFIIIHAIYIYIYIYMYINICISQSFLSIYNPST